MDQAERLRRGLPPSGPLPKSLTGRTRTTVAFENNLLADIDDRVKRNNSSRPDVINELLAKALNRPTPAYCLPEQPLDQPELELEMPVAEAS